jgi:hypothetical protein
MTQFYKKAPENTTQIHTHGFYPKILNSTLQIGKKGKEAVWQIWTLFHEYTVHICVGQSRVNVV